MCLDLAIPHPSPLFSALSLLSATAHILDPHSLIGASSLAVISEHSVGESAHQVSHLHCGGSSSSKTLQPNSEPLANTRIEDAENKSDNNSTYIELLDSTSLSDSSMSDLGDEVSDMDNDDGLDDIQEEGWATDR